MTTLPATPARRLQRPGWRDARLLFGLVLVLLAGALGAKAVVAADERSPVWALAVDVPAGAALEESMVRRVDVRLDDTARLYRPATSPIEPGSITVRDLRQGELLPESALSSAAEASTQRLNVAVSATNARGLVAGSRVDVYVSSKIEGKVVTTRSLESVAVADVLAPSATMGSTRSSAVALLVPTQRVKDVIEAIDNGADVTLVPVAGALVGTAS